MLGIQLAVMELMFYLKSKGFESNQEKQPHAIWSLIFETEIDYVSVTMTGTPFEPILTVAYVNKRDVTFDLCEMGNNVNMVGYVVRAYLRLMLEVAR